MKTGTVSARTFHVFIGILLTFGNVQPLNTSRTDYQDMLKEYQDWLSQTALDGYTSRSCRNSCVENNDKQERSEDDCHCDQHCVAFRDCCLDYWQSCNASFYSAFNTTQQYECIRPELRLSNRTKGKATSGFQVIAKCPVTFQDPEVKRKCQTPEDSESSPFVEGVDGRSYRNEDCARCNGVHNWIIWNTNLSCEDSLMKLIRERLERRNYISFNSTEREKLRSTCIVQMSPPRNSTAFKCKIVQECENSGSHIDYLKCIVYKRQLYFTFYPRIYRNPHCLKCSEVSPYWPIYSLEQQFSETQNNLPSLAVLFDVLKASLIYDSEDIHPTSSCPKNELYDYKQHRCRKQRIESGIAPTQNWTCRYDNETFPNSSAYIIIYKNSSIFVRAHRQTYETKDYFWHDSNVTVCGIFTRHFSKFADYRENELYSEAEFMLSVVGYTLSILALLLVLVTYSLFSELRTLPGKITMNLSIALLLSQMVFLVNMFEDLSPKSCKAVAVILHFLYLSSFCWMTVLAYDVAKTFASKGKTKVSYHSFLLTRGRRSQTHTQHQAFFVCSLYAWGSPLILISITLGVDSSGVLNIGYGNAYFCWITNPWALAIFFVGPVITMLVFNTIALILVLVLIRRERKVTRKAIDRSTAKQDFGICWKLTAVFGLTWMLGIGVQYHIALRIAFILCNSLQGFFLMIGFIMTRRTLNLYLRMAGMPPLISRTAPTRSTVSSSRYLRRRRSSGSVVKAWVKPKPDPNQDIPERIEKIDTVKKCVQMAEITGVRAFQTDV